VSHPSSNTDPVNEDRKRRSGVRTRSKRGLSTLEKAILSILREVDEIDLKGLSQAVKRSGLSGSDESIRKALERLELKGFVTRTARGRYARVKTLDEWFGVKIELPETLVKFSVHEYATMGHELRERLRSLSVPIRKIDDIKSRLHGEWLLGGSAADDSSYPIRPYIRVYTGAVISVYARIRLGGILPFELKMKDWSPSYKYGGIRFIPEHIGEEGGTVEFLVKRLRSPYLERSNISIARELAGLSLEKVRKVIEKFNEYDIIDFNRELIDLALSKAKEKSTSIDLASYVFALVDGSILPGHLDPHIIPPSSDSENEASSFIRELEEENPEVAKELIRRKKKILENYALIYETVRKSDNIILVGAVKNANDKTLQYETGIYYGLSDQKVLASGGLKEGEILGPIREHRLKEWVEQVEKMGLSLSLKEPPIETYYIAKGIGLPLKLEVIFPEDLSEEEKERILAILWAIASKDEVHTKISDDPWQYRYSLYPVIVVDDLARKKAEELATIIKKDLEGKLTRLMEYVAELSLQYKVDIMLLVYNTFAKTLRQL